MAKGSAKTSGEEKLVMEEKTTQCVWQTRANIKYYRVGMTGKWVKINAHSGMGDIKTRTQQAVPFAATACFFQASITTNYFKLIL